MESDTSLTMAWESNANTTGEVREKDGMVQATGVHKQSLEMQDKPESIATGIKTSIM